MASHYQLHLLPFNKKPISLLSSSSLTSFLLLQRTIAKVQPLQCLSTSSSVRRTANYRPTIWDDNYIQSLPIDFKEEKYANHMEKLKTEVRHLIGQQDDLVEQLELVDTICQLGLDYHFDIEIKNLLSYISSSVEHINSFIENSNLHGFALLFRLQREHGITNSSIRWKMVEARQIPDCMKIYLIALFDTMHDIASSFLMERKLDILPCLKRVWADLCKALLLEAQWYHYGYTPTMDEYLENAWITIGGICPIIISYYLSDDLITNTIDGLEFYPPIHYSCILLRLYDDLGTTTEEIERGDVSKSIQCYMKEKHVSESTARDYISSLIRNYWKKLNLKCMISSKNMEPFKKFVLNLPRTAQCFYQYGDGYGDPNNETREQIIRLIIEPIPL